MLRERETERWRENERKSKKEWMESTRSAAACDGEHEKERGTESMRESEKEERKNKKMRVHGREREINKKLIALC